MRQVKQVTQLSREMLRDIGQEAIHLVPLPPYPHWFCRGPRGGVYLAVGERSRSVGETGDDFMQGTLSVLDESEDSRYIRPGSKLHREATESP